MEVLESYVFVLQKKISFSGILEKRKNYSCFAIETCKHFCIFSMVLAPGVLGSQYFPGILAKICSCFLRIIRTETWDF